MPASELSPGLALFASLGFYVVLRHFRTWSDAALKKPKQSAVGRALVTAAQVALWAAAWYAFDTQVLGERATVGEWLGGNAPFFIAAAVALWLLAPWFKKVQDTGTPAEKTRATLMLALSCAAWVGAVCVLAMASK